MSKAAEAHIITLNVFPNMSFPASYNFTDGLLTDTLFKEKSKLLATKATVHSWALAKSRQESSARIPFLHKYYVYSCSISMAAGNAVWYKFLISVTVKNMHKNSYYLWLLKTCIAFCSSHRKFHSETFLFTSDCADLILSSLSQRLNKSAHWYP